MKLTELKKISPERLKLLREVEPLRPLSRKGGRVYFSELGKGFSERTLESNAVKFAAGDNSATPLKLFEWHPTMKVHYFISARQSNPGRKHIHTTKFERCVRDVSKRGTAKDPYAVCTAGIGYKGSLKAGHRRRNPARSEADQTAAHELMLYANNTGELYPQKVAILKNLAKKMQKGQYIPEKAIKLWGYWVDEAARRYNKEFGSGPGFGPFNAATRRLTAGWLEREQRDRVPEFGNVLDKYREKNPARGEYGVFVSGVLKRSYGSEHHAEQYARALRLHKPFKGERIEVMRLPASVKPMRASNPIRPVYYTVHAHKGSEKFWLGRDGKLHRKQSDGKRFRTVIEAKDAARRHLTKFPSSRSYRFEIQLAY
jgi:hypothetical protein